MKFRSHLLFPFIAITFIIFTHCACGGGVNGSSDDFSEVAARDTVYPLGFCTDSFDVVQGKVRGGENFSSLLSRLGMSQQQAHGLITAAGGIFDPKRLRAGNSWSAYFNADTTEVRQLQYLVYEQDRVNLVVFGCADSLFAHRVEKPVEVRREAADILISSSLWNDMLAAGAPALMIVELSEVFAWTVDFFGLRKEDRFKVLYDCQYCEGEVIGIAGIPYATFERDGKVLQSIMFDQGDGGNKYWNEKGESMKKAFLKAPLKFTRISSGFSYHRRHPVHGTVRPHTGVDYAAPTGTPVMSIGDGTVVSVGWGGGGGKTVKIRHNSVYTTAYLHLSKYAKGLKAGSRVRQGDVIGYVGMTGTATGPHLDFRVWKNGTPINPLKMESPSAEPILPENLPALDSLRIMYTASLDSALVARKTTDKILI